VKKGYAVKHLGGLGALLMSLNIQAVEYTSFLENGAWTAEGTVFECSLKHNIPYYGDAIFKTRAGESSRFYLTGPVARFKTGQATLVARAPVWSDQPQHQTLSSVAVRQATKSVQLPSATTELMLHQLFKGLELSFQHPAWYAHTEQNNLVITTVGFRAVYKVYQECLANLLPASFEQIARTSIYFGSDQYRMTASEVNKLDNIVAYLKVDNSIQELILDGHTDHVGTDEDNLILAQKRAETVTQYLVDKGIDKKIILSRWHGEAYPVANNNTVAGRAKNRRVTLRLEKVKSVEAPSITKQGEEAKPSA
jgi:sodium-type flagellar protein MotY